MNPVTKTISYWACLNTVWTDITSYCLQEIPKQSYRGMASNAVDDRLARVGSFTFTVQNITGKFDPDSATALAGWGKGTLIEMRVLYQTRSFKRFRGHIDSIKPNDISNGDHTCTVTVYDFMDYIYNAPFTTPAIQTNKTGDVAVNALIAALPIQPQATSIQVGSYTYPAIFDTATTGTKMSTELQKIVNSEGSYFYVRCDNVYGETLVFENALARNGLVTKKATETYNLPIPIYNSHYLIDHLGRYLVDHLGRKLKANEATTHTFDYTFTGSHLNSQDRNNGTVINKATIKAYPKKTDTSNQVLYKLDSPMLLGSGETKTFNGRYTNPTQTTSTQVNAVQTSMSVTTKTMNTASDGSGTDLSANLTATAVFYSSYPEWTVTNSSGYAGYITVLTASGLGIYQDNPIEFSVQDTTSQNTYGVNELKIDQQYQRDIAAGAQLVAGVLDENKQPSTKWDKVTFLADKSDELMIAFLNVDIGDMIRITNSSLNTDSWYYIQGIEFTISTGELIMFSWIIKRFLNLTLGLSIIVLELNGNAGEKINFGYIQDISKSTQYSYSFWINVDAIPATSSSIVGNLYRTALVYSGAEIYFDTNGRLGFHIGANGGHCFFVTNDVVITTGNLINIVVTFDNSTTGNAPLFYVNKVLKSTYTPIGGYVAPKMNDEGNNLFIGENTGVYEKAMNGTIEDVRFYNNILSQTRVTALYDSGPNVLNDTNGLSFQAFTVRTKDISKFTNLVLAGSDKIMDSIHGYIGTPIGSPISRLP
jgi:hypothetical protein